MSDYGLLDLVVMSGTLIPGEYLFETPSQYGQATIVGLEANTSMFGASTISCEKGQALDHITRLLPSSVTMLQLNLR
jgi:hypothetical protein